MFVIYDGVLGGSMTFIGPFLTNEDAVAYCELNDTPKTNVIELTEPREESGSVYDLLKTLGDALDEAANNLSDDEVSQELSEELSGHALNCRTATMEFKPL